MDMVLKIRATTRLLLSILIGLSFCLSACNWQSDRLIPKPGDTSLPAGKEGLVISNGTEPETLDPQKAVGQPEIQVISDLFEGLMSEDNEGRLVPGVADHWQNQDDKTWVFHIREDAKWSNGAPLTAHDFVYAWQRLSDPQTASSYAGFLTDMQIENADRIIKGELPPSALGVEAKNSHTLVVHLSKPVPYLLQMLINSATFPNYRSAIEKYGNKWTQPEHIVSNGAFRLSGWYVNNRVVVKKNPYYWDSKNVHLNEITYLPIQQPMADVIAFLSGRIDITSGSLPPAIYEKLKKIYSKEIYDLPVLCTTYYEINLHYKPFQDGRVRQALSILVNRSDITDRLLRQGQKICYTLTPSNMPGFKVPRPEFADWTMEKRIAKAKELLSKAGYNHNHPLKFSILYANKDSNKMLTVALVSEWKSKIPFIEVTLDNKEWKSYLQARRQHQFEMVYSNWCADYHDATTFLNIFRSDSTNNHNYYHSTTYDTILNTGLDTHLSKDEREKVYARAEQQLFRDVPFIALYTTAMPRLVKPYVRGINAKTHAFTIRSKYLSLQSDFSHARGIPKKP